MKTTSPGPDKESNWLPTPKGPFYPIFRNYAPDASVSEGLKDRATFQGPPGVMPVGEKWEPRQDRAAIRRVDRLGDTPIEQFMSPENVSSLAGDAGPTM